ncbi:MAG: hypothetical protein WBW85_02350 [Terriglobales bacterium]
MFHKATRLRGISANCSSDRRLSDHGALSQTAPARLSFRLAIFLVLAATILLSYPAIMLAQRGGGAGSPTIDTGGTGINSGSSGGRDRTPVICVHDCAPPGAGLTSEDTLKNFHRAMALQANAEQRAAFAKITQYTQSATAQLQELRESLENKSPQQTRTAPLPDRATALDQAIARARAGIQNFLSSLSAAQKSGLKDFTGRLEKAEAELDKQIKAFDQIVQTPTPGNDQIAASAAGLDQELTSFQQEQLALGRGMGILLPGDSDALTLNLPAITNSVDIAGETINIPASGVISRTATQNGQNLFSLRLTADLSDLQLNITDVLRSKLDRAPRCGERIQVEQATLTPLIPASVVVADLHFERWACPLGASLQDPMEVASGEGTLEVKLTPFVHPNTGLSLDSEITRVDAQGLFRNMLRSGDLGVSLRDQIAAALLSALQQGASLKSTLPLAVQPAATLQKAEFQDAGADQLNLVLDGHLLFSDAQTKQFVTQLKQPLSAQTNQ